MLNFLNNRKDQQPARVGGLQRNPNVTYGISIQSPKEFSNQHSMISNNTYYNPHLNYESHKTDRLAQNKSPSIHPEWTRKTNMNLIEDQKVINIKEEDGSSPFVYKDSYYKELSKNKTRFRLVKGEFSSFIHNQHRNEILGPLEGQERTLQRARQTRKSIMQKSITSLQKLKSNMSRYSSSFQRLEQSPIKEKFTLRESREAFYKEVKKEQDDRRFRKSQDFLLPKVIKKVYKGGKNSYLKTIDTNLQSYRY